MSMTTALKAYGKQITVDFSCGGQTIPAEKITVFNPSFEGALLRTVMRKLDIELCDMVSLPGSTITAGRFGAKAPEDASFSYITYGTYDVYEPPEADEDAGTLSVTCYDLMLRSMIPYDLSIDYTSGDVTVKDLLDLICTRLGYTRGYTTFTNSSVVLTEEVYDNSVTFRDVLDEIAAASASTIAFDNQDRLCVIYPTSSGQTIAPDNLREMRVGKKYGPINSIVLARTPQEDNIYLQDEESIGENGITELKIENVRLIDNDRAAFIQGILDALNGLTFYEYELESYGIGVIDLCQTFTLQKLDGSTYPAICLSDDLRITQGVSEEMSAEAPDETVTDYSAASKTDKMINQTILRVNKQQGEIDSLVTQQQQIDGRTGTLESTVTQTASSLQAVIANVESNAADIGEIISRMEGVGNDMSAITNQITQIVETASGLSVRVAELEVGEVTEITTETGYTFGADGLRIQQAGNEIENLVDYRGMRVTKNGDEDVLVADAEGVHAINLTADKYLIVGHHSRFEDYGNGRTGCFYIGG